MGPLTSLILLIILATGSLAIVSIVNKRQLRETEKRHKLFRLKMRVEELEELVEAVDKRVDNRDIAEILHKLVIEKLEQMIEVAPDTDYVQVLVESANARAEQLKERPSDRHTNIVASSDSQIVQIKRQLSKAATYLKSMQQNNQLDSDQVKELTIELRWLHLQVEVRTFIAQGHRARNRRDPITSSAFYKRAQQMLMESAINDPRKHNQIKELAEILNGTKLLLECERPADAFLTQEEIDQHQRNQQPLTQEQLEATDEHGFPIHHEAPKRRY